MTDTKTQREVEAWVRREWMPKRYGQTFSEKNLRLSSGGVFEFDAVSADGKIVANVSTSGSKTSSGKGATGKMMKVRSDIYFLLLARAERRVVLLTEQDMYEHWLKEVEKGRVPKSIELEHVKIPTSLNARLISTRRKASREVTPGKGTVHDHAE